MTKKNLWSAALIAAATGLAANAGAAVLITEVADPNNEFNDRFVELYNTDAVSVDVTGWALRLYSNGGLTPGTTFTFPATTTIPAHGFLLIGGNSFGVNFSSSLADLNSGVINSNGDDVYELIDGSLAVVDVFGEVGVDGTGTVWEYEDGRAERKDTITSGNATFDPNEWNIDSDAPTGDGPQDSPGGFDPKVWIGEVVVPSTGVTLDGTLDVGEGYITIEEVDPTLREGFGSAIDASGSYYTSDTLNHYFFIRGKLDTGNSNGILTFIDFESTSGLSAGTDATVGGGGHALGQTGNAFQMDVEYDFAFAANPGGGATNVFVDFVDYATPLTEFAGSVAQDGSTTASTSNGISFAFNNGGGLDQGFEICIPDSIISSAPSDLIKVFAVVASNTAFFSNDSVPANIGSANVENAPNFLTGISGVQARALEVSGDYLPRVQSAYAFNGQVIANYDSNPLFNLAFGSDFDIWLNGATAAATNPVTSGATGGAVDVAALPTTSDTTGDVFGDFFYATDVEFYAYPNISLIQDGTIATGTPVGVFATVTGITSPSGGNDADGDGDGDYAIADASGAYNGIIVDDGGVTTPVLNNDIEINGTVGDRFGMTYLDVNSAGQFIDLGAGTAIAPVIVAAADFAATNTTNSLPAEQYEGVLIEIQGLNAPAAESFGEYRFAENVKTDDHLYNPNARYTAAGAGATWNITGIGTFSFGEYKIWPRSNADIVGFGGANVSDWMLIED
ncbi:MAG: lamin tail domain-containing protein [Sumerlaeia bacterium]